MISAWLNTLEQYIYLPVLIAFYFFIILVVNTNIFFHHANFLLSLFVPFISAGEYSHVYHMGATELVSLVGFKYVCGYLYDKIAGIIPGRYLCCLWKQSLMRYSFIVTLHILLKYFHLNVRTMPTINFLNVDPNFPLHCYVFVEDVIPEWLNDLIRGFWLTHYWHKTQHISLNSLFFRKASPVLIHRKCACCHGVISWGVLQQIRMF